MFNETVNYSLPNFRIITKSYEKYSMGANHFHDSYELYYLIEGSRKYFINDKTYTIGSGTLVLIEPYVLHHTIDTGQSHSRLLISFKPDYLPFIDFDLIIRSTFLKHNIIVLNTETKAKVEHIFKLMIRDANEQPLCYQSSLQAHLCRLLIDVCQSLHQDEQDHKHSEDDNIKIYDIINYLKEHYNEKITLEDLSDQFFISRFYLSHSFKKITGMTIIRYVQNLRVIESQRLLRDTNMKISDIAELVGFPTISAFGKTFKLVSSQSPSEYRKAMG